MQIPMKKNFQFFKNLMSTPALTGYRMLSDRQFCSNFDFSIKVMIKWNL